MAHYRSSLYGVAAVSHVPKASACSLLAPHVSPHRCLRYLVCCATSPALGMFEACASCAPTCTTCSPQCRLCMWARKDSWCSVCTGHCRMHVHAGA